MGQGFPSQRVGVNVSAGTGLALTGTVVLSNSNNVSFGMQTSGSSYVVTATATVAAINAISGGTTLASTGTISFADSNGISFGMNGQTMTLSTGVSFLDWENISYWRGLANVTNLTAILDRPFFMPIYLPYYLTLHRLVWEGSRATTNADNAFTVTVGVYTLVNSTQASLLGSVSNAYSGTDRANQSGVRQFYVMGFPNAVTNMTPGIYIMGFHFHTFGGTASMNYSIRGGSTADLLGVIGSGTNATSTATSQISTVGMDFMGQYSVTTASLPDTVGENQLFHGMSGSQNAVNAWFRLARTA